MPKVLLLCEHPSLNGGEWSLLSMLDGLRREGFRLSAAAPPAGPLADALRRRGVAVAPISFHDARGRRLPLEQLKDRVRSRIAAEGPDLVHANSVSMSRLAGPAAAEAGVASVGHLRDILRISGAAAADLNRHARLLAVSRAVGRWHKAQGVSAEKIRVLYNGVDLDRFQPRPPTGYLHRELGLPAGALLVGSIGQIGLRKGQDVLLEAAGRVALRAPEVRFLVIGRRYSRKEESVRYEEELRQAAERPPLRGRVCFLGVRRDIPRLLNELTLLAHAARQEPLGRVLLEAAASGIAVAAADVGGTREIFPDPSAARISAPGRPELLADAMLELLRCEGLRRRLGAAARRRVEQVFDVRRTVRALASHYREVLAGRSGPPDPPLRPASRKQSDSAAS